MFKYVMILSLCAGSVVQAASCFGCVRRVEHDASAAANAAAPALQAAATAAGISDYRSVAEKMAARALNLGFNALEETVPNIQKFSDLTGLQASVVDNSVQISTSSGLSYHYNAGNKPGLMMRLLEDVINLHNQTSSPASTSAGSSSSSSSSSSAATAVASIVASSSR